MDKKKITKENEMKNLLMIILITTSLSAFACSKNNGDTLFVAFWNVENLFDTIDDLNKDDSEFLPSSKKEWDEEKLEKKMFNLSRVIISMNNGEGPDLMGFAECENEAVFTEMVNKHLSNFSYNIAYRESPDNRGIDVAFIYNKNKFDLVSVIGDTVTLPSNYPTRLILSITLKTKTGEDLYIFVNHWPSRRGGETESEKNRIAAAEVLRTKVDELFKTNPDSKIIIMGDFNDEPNNVSITDHLKANYYDCNAMIAGNIPPMNELYNLAAKSKQMGLGSFKFQTYWNLIDQIIISGALLGGQNFDYICDSFEIYKPYFMVTRSGKYEGAPLPTYGGDRYIGGYSDHFPVIAKFLMK